MNKKELQELAISALMSNVDSYLYPTYDEDSCGPYLGGGSRLMIESVEKILEIDPNYNHFPKNNNRFIEELKSSKSKKCQALAKKLDPPIWKMKTGEIIEIPKMDDKHLLNTINMLNRKGLNNCSFEICNRYDNLVTEAKKRKIYKAPKTQEIDYYDDTDIFADGDYDEFWRK